jgi:hypothetical protein
LADGAAKHEITNWIRRSGWTAHFVGRDLGEIHGISRMLGPGEEEARRLVVATDRLFFNRCVAGLRSMSLMIRLLLASLHPTDAHSKPFRPLQEKTSLNRYVSYWKRLLCYYLRVLLLNETTLLERHGFQFTPEQRVGLEALWEHLRDEDRAEKELEEKVLQVSAGFWKQRLAEKPLASPLWHFVAVLGIDGKPGTIAPCAPLHVCTGGTCVVGRALLSEFVIPARERDTMKDLEGRFAAVRDDWLCKATYPPMGYTLSLLLCGKEIAREMRQGLMVLFDEDYVAIDDENVSVAVHTLGESEAPDPVAARHPATPCLVNRQHEQPLELPHGLLVLPGALPPPLAVGVQELGLPPAAHEIFQHLHLFPL